MVHGPGVVIGRSGSLGGGQFITDDFWPLNTTLWVKDFKGNDRRFCYYLLKSLNLAYFNAGSGVPTLNRNHIHPLPVTVPKDLHEQRAIAHILGTLDDKIELNRRMSETLEAIARALFKSWFVDFEPVRAKMEGRWQRGQSLPGLPAHLYDLFPDALEDSELGEIPEGWSVGSFGSFISQRSERAGKRNVVVLSAVASGMLVRSDDHFTKRVYSKETDKYLVVEQWDYAYNPSRINIGSVGMLEEDILGGVSPVYVVVRPHPAYRWFLWFSIQRAYTKTWINMLASGSVRQSLSYADFASIPCVVPSEEVVEEFNQKWSTLREVLLLRDAESRTLAALRDALLPKLISGELRVKDAERFLEERGL
jgi:type I restriction enzyme S subunit